MELKDELKQLIEKNFKEREELSKKYFENSKQSDKDWNKTRLYLKKSLKLIARYCHDSDICSHKGKEYLKVNCISRIMTDNDKNSLLPIRLEDMKRFCKEENLSLKLLLKHKNELIIVDPENVLVDYRTTFSNSGEFVLIGQYSRYTLIQYLIEV